MLRVKVFDPATCSAYLMREVVSLLPVVLLITKKLFFHFDDLLVQFFNLGRNYIVLNLFFMLSYRLPNESDDLVFVAFHKCDLVCQL